MKLELMVYVKIYKKFIMKLTYPISTKINSEIKLAIFKKQLN